MYNERRQREIRELKKQMETLQKNKKLIEEKIIECRERITVLMMEEMIAGTPAFREERETGRKNTR